MDVSVKLLHRAGDLVRSGWSQHADARSADGAEVRPWESAAVAWSLLGSLVAALEEEESRGSELPLHHLAVALDELARFVDDDSLSGWNDQASRTQAEVVTALDAAATAALRRVDGSRN